MPIYKGNTLLTTGGGTTVAANPGGDDNSKLTSITIGSTDYDLAGENIESSSYETISLTLTGNANTVQGGVEEEVRIYLNEDFNSGSTNPTSYSFDPDTANSVYSGDITNEVLTANANATTALGLIADDIIALVNGGSKSSVGTQAGYFAGGFSQVGGSFTWGFPSIHNSVYLCSTSSACSTHVTTATANDWNGKYIHYNYVVNTSIENLGISAGDVIRLSHSNSGNNYVEVEVASVSHSNNWIRLASSGAEFSGTGFNTLTPDLDSPAYFYKSEPTDAKYIDVNLGTTTNIAQTMTMTANGGSNVEFELGSVNDGVPGSAATTVTITDYSNTEITSLTCTSNESASSLGARIATAITNNEETPIDFEGSFSSGTLTLKATEVGSTSGSWSFAIDNQDVSGDNEGDLTFGTQSKTETNVYHIDPTDLPTSDPEVDGVLYITSDGTLKISTGE